MLDSVMPVSRKAAEINLKESTFNNQERNSVGAGGSRPEITEYCTPCQFLNRMYLDKPQSSHCLFPVLRARAVEKVFKVF